MAPESSQGPLPLVKYLVAAGLGSRRDCTALVQAGRVTVNGAPATGYTQPVSPQDRVAVDGRPLAARRAEPVYLLLNKPTGYLSAVSDDRGRPTVLDLVPRGLHVPGLVPVGRLDLDSAGLLLLTNDGDLAYRLTHPRYEVEKEYVATLDRPMPPDAPERLAAGVELPDGAIGRARIEAIPVDPLLPPTGPRYRVTLREGRKREVRLLLVAMGSRVVSLERVRMGPMRLGDLPRGTVRALTKAEVERLRRGIPIA